MEKEINETEISLSDIWKRLLKHKILIIIIVMAITLVGSSTVFLLNKSNRTVSNEFTYTFSGRTSNRYPDGSIFNINELADEAFLEQVKASDASFKDLNITDLVNNGNFNISIVNTYGETNKDQIIRSHYKIEVPLQFFGTKELSELFIMHMHQEFLSNVLDKNDTLNIVNYLDYDSFNDFAGNKTYNEILSIYSRQHSNTLTTLDNFLNTHNSVNVNIDGKNVNLQTLYTEYLIWYSENVDISRLRTEANIENYVRPESTADTIRKAKSRIIEIDRAIAKNLLAIDELTLKAKDLNYTGNNNETTVFFESIEKLTIHNIDLTFEKADLEVLLDDNNHIFNESYNNEIISISEGLNDHLDNFNEVIQTYLNDYTRYTRINTRDFQVNNPYNLMMMVVVIGLVSVIVASVIALVIPEDKENLPKEV